MTVRPDEEEAVRESSIPVDVLRLTPLVAGVPDHTAASVWQFHDRATLSLVDVFRYSTAPFGVPVRTPERVRVIAGLLTGRDFICHRVTEYVDRYLDEHHTRGVAIETWGQVNPSQTQTRPHWWYAVLPRIIRLPFGAEDWPVEEPHNITVHTAAEAHPNPAHTFAAPRPYPGPARPLDAGTYVRQAMTRVPPPAAPYSLRATSEGTAP
ncbi:hypothetical protein [Streptomyces sp. NPDC088847]|uniref:hypothetical protein n=1 Tax=Streptomyces sp. NPDC088847 TaxID=3365909 RepID=UPI00382E85DA